MQIPISPIEELKTSEKEDTHEQINFKMTKESS